MSKKTERVPPLLKKIKPRWQSPEPLPEGGLLEQGMLAILRRHLPQDRSVACFGRLRKAYADWNEMRVAQIQETAAVMRPTASARSKESVAEYLAPAGDLKTYLQEVFQKTHGLDLEVLREDPQGAGKLIAQLEFLGLANGAFLLWLAEGKEVPVHPALIRVLDRLSLITRTQSLKKARAAIEPLVPKGKELEFAVSFGEVADRWCDARKPLCHECPLVDDCPHGKKAYKEWEVQQARLKVQREREEARRIAQEKKEEERRKRDAERARKKLEAEQRKAERERQRAEKAAAREREKLAKQKARDEARKKEAAKREAERKRKVEAKKKAAKKKTTKKKTTKKATKKATAKKTTNKPVRKAAKKVTRKKVAKKAGRTTKAAGKKTTKKATAKKARKKSTAKKATSTGKAATRKTTRKKAPRRK